MPSPKHFDPSPLVSLICGGYYRQTKQVKVQRTYGTMDWTLIYTLSGQGHFAAPFGDGERLVTQPGLLLLVAPGTGSISHAAPGAIFEHLWLHFLPRPHWIDWLDWPVDPTGFQTLLVPTDSAKTKVRRLFQEIVYLTSSSKPDREAFALHSLEGLLLQCKGFNRPSESPRHDPLIQACLEHIDRNLSQAIKLADLARATGQSVSRVTHKFNQQIGFSPMQYLEKCRMERAMELLNRTNVSIKEISNLVGFENPFYFSLRFHKYSGCSPSVFRRKNIQPGTIFRHP